MFFPRVWRSLPSPITIEPSVDAPVGFQLPVHVRQGAGCRGSNSDFFITIDVLRRSAE